MAHTYTRDELKAMYELFNEFAYKDQYHYYVFRIERNRMAGRQVNRIRALFALITGASSALAALMIAVGGQDCAAGTGLCNFLQSLLFILPILPIISVVAPALGAGFTTLGDLFQWDRTLSLYKSALENMEVADSLSPVDDPDETDADYRSDLIAFAEGTLKVMRDESGQWGSLITTPKQIEKFVEAAQQRSDDVIRGTSGDGEDAKDKGT